MGHIIADAGMQKALAGVLEPVEVRTSEGVVLGLYTPAIDPRQAALHARFSHVFDPEEARRIAAAEPEGLPLAEVWKRIHAPEPKG